MMAMLAIVLSFLSMILFLATLNNVLGKEYKYIKINLIILILTILATLNIILIKFLPEQYTGIIRPLVVISLMVFYAPLILFFFLLIILIYDTINLLVKLKRE